MPIIPHLSSQFTANDLQSHMVALGQYAPWVTIARKVGFAPALTTAAVPADIWNGGGLYTGFPATALQTFSVASSSALDTAAGTGARTLRIVGLDTNWNEIEEVVTLNGVTPVTTVNQYRRLVRAQVLTSGAVGGVNNMAFNAGTLTIRHTTTTTNVFCVIPIGANNSRVSAYTVPANYTAILIKLVVGIDRAVLASIAGDLVVQRSDKSNSPLLLRPFTVSNATSWVDELDGGVVLNEKTDIIVRVRTCTTTAVPAYCNYEMLLFRNG